MQGESRQACITLYDENGNVQDRMFCMPDVAVWTMATSELDSVISFLPMEKLNVLSRIEVTLVKVGREQNPATEAEIFNP